MRLKADDHLLLLISGGGSALLPAPAVGISLEQKIALNDSLLASGLDIHDMNVIRRLFSTLKGGRLARLAAPAKITQFLLSDVPGDRLESIASGVAVADPVPFDYAKDLVKTHRLDQLDFVARHMAALTKYNELAKNDELAPVRPGDPCLDRVHSTILASNAQCRDAAANWLATEVPGLVQLDAPELAGEAQQMAHQLVKQICKHKVRSSIKRLALSAAVKRWFLWIVRLLGVAAGLKNWHLLLLVTCNRLGPRCACQLGGIGRGNRWPRRTNRCRWWNLHITPAARSWRGHKCSATSR